MAMTAPETAQDARTRTCVLRFDGEFIRARFHDGAEVGLEDARENVAVTASLVRGRPRPAIIDLRPVRSQSADARAYLAGPEADAVISAVALVIGSPLSRMVGNFYLGFNRPNVPTRLFTDVADAEAWLRGLGARRT